jgi:hypothetical protein
MRGEVLAQLEREKAGVRDPAAAHAATPLSAHFAAWAADLAAGGRTPKHVRQTAGWVRRVIAGTTAVLPADLTAEAGRAFRARLRQDRPLPPLDPGKENYTRDELGAVLGVKASAVTSLVRRHRLTATGIGKARRYPAATAQVLAALRARGMSPKPTNHYLGAAQQFTRWLARNNRLPADPLADLKPATAEADRRRERRVPSADELRRVVTAARASPKAVRGLSGRDRAAPYGTAIGTGFRAEELSRLAPRHFAPAAASPHVYLSATETKNGRAVEQPLPPDAAAGRGA